MLIKVEKAVNLEAGDHQGIIINVRYRERPYAYVDLEIETKADDETIMKLKAGYPQGLTEKSMLGRLLSAFGTELEVGSSVDPNAVLIGKQCKFKTINEETDKGIFAKVIPSSVQPLDIDSFENEEIFAIPSSVQPPDIDSFVSEENIEND